MSTLSPSCMRVRVRTPSLLFSFSHVHAPSIARMLPLFSLSLFPSIHCPSCFSKPTRAFACVLFVSVSHSGVHAISCFSLSLLLAATVTIFCILAQTCANRRGLTLTATHCFDHCCVLSPPVTYCCSIAPTITHCCNLHKLLWHSVLTCKVTHCGGLTQTVILSFIFFHTYP